MGMNNNNIRSVLITGGAGFIGSRLALALLKRKYKVRILDNLNPQVHGLQAQIPSELAQSTEVMIGDVKNASIVRTALKDMECVVHLAAETGPAQSMYEIERYISTNVQGTATLLQEILQFRKQVRRIVIASSRAIYGEGKYLCSKCGIIVPSVRSLDQLASAVWEPVCGTCGNIITLQATTEDTPPAPTSVYAVSKLSQEQMGLVFGHAYRIPIIALRYQNVYGAGQSLRNPYIGILAIFCARILEKLPIHIYEDGQMLRDFVNINDVVSATILAIESEPTISGAYNVGYGRPYTILDVAKKLIEISGSSVPINVTGEYRVGDIRHNYSDLKKIKQALGYEPCVTLEAGLHELFEWARNEPKIANLLENATKELTRAGLFQKGI
jgi:dTDP-L-rhamnose 4-epimerase